MIKRRLMIMLSAILLLGAPTAQAKVTNYIVKNNTNYTYNVQKLGQSYLDYTEGAEAKLYNEYVKNVKEGTVLAFQDDTGKYVSYTDIVNAFLAASESGQTFNLSEFLKTAKTMQINGVNTEKPKEIKEETTNSKIPTEFDSDSWFVDNSKLYTAVDFATTKYEEDTICIDYNKSLGALENITILDPIKIEIPVLESGYRTFTVTFPKEMKKEDFILNKTMKSVYATNKTDCHEFPEVMSVNGNTVTFQINFNGVIDSMYIFFYGIRDMKPLVLPLSKTNSKWVEYYRYLPITNIVDITKKYYPEATGLKYKYSSVGYKDLKHLEAIKDLLSAEEYSILETVRTKIDRYNLLTRYLVDTNNLLKRVTIYDEFDLDNNTIQIFCRGRDMDIWVYTKGSKKYYASRIPKTGWSYDIKIGDIRLND
ncbi:hypothetical protein OW763_14020 [Clostridium aestuarii]|uniref:Uncharacterized protein n=1 Tax=Clostridium aestuarii TaxID=338193 RepID=A0ABT4D2G8_9CLOT|nr:hypothetical protein [Clostridium aestuarii]MCY6485446.1 hypothetical protein [Clostridium aestuarii]